MCFICDGGTYEELHQRTRDRIDSGRWSLSGLEGFFPWTYTIGLADHGLPELVMLGPTGRAAKVLNDLGDQLCDGLHLGAGSAVEANRECLVIGEVHRLQIERGLVAGWFDYHDWAGSLPALQLLQVMTLAKEPHPVLSARSLAGTGNPLGL